MAGNPLMFVEDAIRPGQYEHEIRRHFGHGRIGADTERCRFGLRLLLLPSFHVESAITLLADGSDCLIGVQSFERQYWEYLNMRRMDPGRGRPRVVEQVIAIPASLTERFDTAPRRLERCNAAESEGIGIDGMAIRLEAAGQAIWPTTRELWCGDIEHDPALAIICDLVELGQNVVSDARLQEALRDAHGYICPHDDRSR